MQHEQQFVNQQLQEIVPHGTAFLPVQFYLNQPLNEQVFLYTHWHEKIEILGCQEGSFEMTIENETFPVHEGEYVIVNQAFLHSARALAQGRSTHHALIFDFKLLNSFLYDFSQNQFLDPLLKKELFFPHKITRTTDWGRQCCEELDAIFHNFHEQRFGWELSVKANLLKVVSILLLEQQFVRNHHSDKQIKHEKVHMLKTTIDYLQQHTHTKVTIAELAALINVSPEYFCRFFKQHTGLTAIEYLHQLRIERAVNLLLNTDLSVLDVSLQVGFDDQSYFSKKFKALKGLTPAKFRKQYTLFE